MRLLLLCLLLAVHANGQTGPDVPDLAAFDEQITSFMARWSVPGGALAISRDGRLIFARGYGLADGSSWRVVQPTSLFRIASVSKPITAAAILRLHEEGRLHLDDRVVDRLPDLVPSGGLRDARAAQITIRDLLRHSGGWDAQAVGIDVQFAAHEIASARGVTSPPSAADVAAYAFDQPLQHAPGTAFAYANAGYTILGRIIERITNKPYETFVRESVLLPIGARCLWIGGTFESEARPGEVRYSEGSSLGPAQSVLDPNVEVPWPYGGFDMRALDAAGGWIASAIDVVRFTDAIDRHGSDTLLPATTAQMISRPPYEQGAFSYYALGWVVQENGIWFHTGGLPGTASYLLRLPDGLNLFAVFNTLPFENDAPSGRFYTELDRALGLALSRTQRWPAHDLYPQMTTCVPRRRATASP